MRVAFIGTSEVVISITSTSGGGGAATSGFLHELAAASIAISGAAMRSPLMWPKPGGKLRLAGLSAVNNPSIEFNSERSVRV
jgi:hypothetical protein